MRTPDSAISGIFLLAAIVSPGQDLPVQGKVTDGTTHEPISGVHIVGYGDKVYGNSSNDDGLFVLNRRGELDSIRISCIGYTSRVLYPKDFQKNPVEIALVMHVNTLEALTVTAPTPQQVIRSAVQAMPVNYRTDPFQVRGFYREQIRNDSTHFSVGEAVFEGQLFPGRAKDDRCLMKLIQGRRSETVRSTRIFEDYHPGGGPNYLMEHMLEVGVPEFLLDSNFGDYVYSIDSITSYEGKDAYLIVFDQRESLRQNLWTGKIFVDVHSFAILEMDYDLSAKGVAYRKHLTGKDKVMADLLGIDFDVMTRKTKVSYRKSGTHWMLHEARLTMDIHFTQPRKDIDEQFTFAAEMLALSHANGPIVAIPKTDLWHKNQLVKNLPGEFDENFWGADNFIQPDSSLTAVVASMKTIHASTLPTGSPEGWQFLNSSKAKAYARASTILLKPYTESHWKDVEQGPFLWKSIEGDFQFDTHVRVSKASDTLATPDMGFQVGGLMIRASTNEMENSILFGIGCMGNPNLKIVTQNTINGNSAIHVSQIGSNTLRLRMTRTGNLIELHYLLPGSEQWQLLRQVTRKDLPQRLHYGLAGYSYFPGNAPNRKPNLLISADHLTITSIGK